MERNVRRDARVGVMSCTFLHGGGIPWRWRGNGSSGGKRRNDPCLETRGPLCYWEDLAAG